jgi:hypothetical protein
MELSKYTNSSIKTLETNLSIEFSKKIDHLNR